jgi:hypothetical protein
VRGEKPTAGEARRRRKKLTSFSGWTKVCVEKPTAGEARRRRRKFDLFFEKIAFSKGRRKIFGAMFFKKLRANLNF